MFNFFTKALIKRQLKDVPQDKVDKILEVIEKNPAFFQQMASTIQAKMKNGMSQEQAMQSFIAESGDEVKKVIGNI